MRRAAAVLLVLLTACTSSGDKATPALGHKGGTLRVAITQPGSLDPGNAYEPAGMLVDDLLCEPLLTIDPKTREVRPGLAANWVISDGGRRITLRLRKARFSNGQRVTADHVISSLSRAASEEFAGNAAHLLEPIDGFAEINGRVDSTRERDRRRLRGITAIDSSSVSIQLHRKDADFLRVLAHPVAAPVADDDPLVCAGPYKLAEQTPAVIRLVRNEHYHGRHPVYSAGGAGYADTVEFHITPDFLESAAAVDVDVAAVPYGVGGAEVRTATSGHIDYVGLPLGETSPFREARVRRALSAALDRSTLLAGRPAERGFLPTVACDDEPEDAVDLGAVDMPLYFTDQFANRALAESVAAQWHKAFGITLRPTPTTFDRIAEMGAKPSGVDGAFLMGWRPLAPRPEAYLGPLFTSAGIGRDNVSRFVDPDFERILDRDARGGTDEDDVSLGYEAAARRLCDQLPMIPLVAGMSRWAIRTGVATDTPLDAVRGQPVLRELFGR